MEELIPQMGASAAAISLLGWILKNWRKTDTERQQNWERMVESQIKNLTLICADQKREIMLKKKLDDELRTQLVSSMMQNKQTAESFAHIIRMFGEYIKTNDARFKAFEHAQSQVIELSDMITLIKSKRTNG